ncbi:MAG: UDP-2,3-diacylglucosamine diphosphatase LpxI [Rhodobacteraceae bacterium]|nr:UDP-2,3-diacylglucosamine diphosphatase LpxI [Paracoccaceae bacterium]
MLAIIAGSGRLPAAIVDAVADRPVICVLEGFAPEGMVADEVFRIECLGSFLKKLRYRGVTDICMAGAVQRQPVNPLKVDSATMPLVPILKRAITSGDDAALRMITKTCEDMGFRVRGAHELAPALLPPAGILTQTQPSDHAWADARRGKDIVAAMAAADIGQACVVHRCQALGIETVLGTDWMLQSLEHRGDGCRGGVFYKAPKPGQDRRADLPVIGVNTVSAAIAAGLDGLVIVAQGVMVLDRAEVIAACDSAGLFLWVQEV